MTRRMTEEGTSTVREFVAMLINEQSQTTSCPTGSSGSPTKPPVVTDEEWPGCKIPDHVAKWMHRMETARRIRSELNSYEEFFAAPFERGRFWWTDPGVSLLLQWARAARRPYSDLHAPPAQ